MFDPDHINKDACIKPKINIYMLIMFFVLAIPMITYEAFRYIDSNIGSLINTPKSMELSIILKTDKSLKDFRRKEELKQICDEFLSIAGKYGYTSKEIINEIKQH